MPHFFFHFDDEIEKHLADHDVTPEDFRAVVSAPDSTDVSRTSGRPIAFGHTSDGRCIICVYEQYEDLIIPVTAYEVLP